MLLLYPQVLRAAVLFSPMVPLRPEQRPALSGVAVFVAAGSVDPIVPAENTQRLVAMLEEAGAAVTEHWHGGGHELSQTTVHVAREWLSQLLERFSRADFKKNS
jgi:phospholipase/carboxylesterase